MIENNFFIKNHIQKSHLKSNIIKKFSSGYDKIIKKIKDKKIIQNQFFNLFNNDRNPNINFNDLNRFKKFKNVVLIGMGGSILGSEAIYNFLSNSIKKKFYFLNNLDIHKILNLKKKISSKDTLFIVISKSGNTIETLSNFFYLDILKKNSKNIIIISEKKNNILFNISKKFNLFFIEHKNYIGGRYSVLSEVGLVPAYFMGLNLIKLRKNVSKYLFKEKTLKEGSTKIANILFQKKIPNIVFLNYSSNLDKFLFWAQQLIAESLGKKNKGFFPIISTVPKDHHSLLQLYLDGPKDKLFIIFSTEEKMTKKLKINKFLKNKFFLNNKRLEQIKLAQKKAILKTFKKNKISFREFKIKKINEETIGELFSYFILETILVSKLSNIDPFDQPAVEEVKKITKKILT